MSDAKRRNDPAYWVLVVLTFVALFISGFCYSGWNTANNRYQLAHQLAGQQADTIEQYQDHFKILEAEFYSDQLSLTISRNIAQTYKSDRDNNWSRYQHYQNLYEQCRGQP